MDRNWLIRTTQNQILRPVAKAKVIEFLEKGALGKDDEVASGNGYWFSLKEKELVDKYLYGDIPQGYNPISESKSVLSKRENPEKTTSINTAPANSSQDKSKANNQTGVAPKAEDLEYPDAGGDITLVGVSLSKLPTKPNLDNGKLPSASDLEFPDMGNISRDISSPSIKFSSSSASVPVTASSAKPVQSKLETETSNSPANFKYPDQSNLEYPDMTSVNKNRTQTTLQSPSNLTQTKTVALAKPHVEEAHEDEDRDFTVVMGVGQPASKVQLESAGSAENDVSEIENKPISEKNQIESLIGPIIKEKKSHKPTPAPKPVEERKLLHDRKKQASSDHVEDDTPKAKRPVVSEELKTRNDNYLLYLIILLAIVIVVLFIFYYKTILNKPIPSWK
jgi:hypothetical protein